MAEMVYAADVLYPEFNGSDDIQDIKRYVQNVQDYLFLLREGLGYTLGNLGMQNFNQAAFAEIADVIRKPVQVQLTDQEGQLTEISTSLEGISTTVSSIDGDYVKLSGATQTADGFQFKVVDGYDNTAIQMDASGLTVNNGAIRIKNNIGTEVMKADVDGNILLTGTVQGSEIYGSRLITCASADESTSPHFLVGAPSSVPTIQSFDGTNPNGFRAVGSAVNPFYGLLITSALVDFRTWYDSVTDSVHMGMNNAPIFFGINGTSGGISYKDTANSILNYIDVNSTGIDLVGTVRVNGTPI